MAATDPTGGPPVVRTPQGAVRGTWRGGPGASAAFLGIPFAEPPVGGRRLAAPEPAGGWDGVRDATAYGPTPQRRPLAEVTAIPEPSIPGEDILTLNVFTPAPGDPGARLPVLVWIHGGGFKAGSPASPWYDGSAFNRDGVVTVTISYRLGFDGFGWIPDAPHNRGLLDQIEALRWVRRSIAAFGGDPDRVTVGGQSAGGASVWALMISPPAVGLFSAAISQSGALRPLSAAVARANGEALARAAGVAWTRAGLAALPEDRMLDLAEAVGDPGPPASLDEAVAGLVAADTPRLAYRPYLDGTVLVHDVEDSLRAGASADLPLLMGATAHEFTAAGSAFARLLATGSIRDALARTALAPLAEEYVATYAVLPDGEAAVVGQLMSDLTFRAPTARWADLRAGAPTWLYDFRLAHPGTGLAAHCAELPFAWDLLDAERVRESCHPQPPQPLAEAMHGAWVGFVRDHRAPWPTWSPAGTAMVYDTDWAAGPAYRLERRVAALLDARPDRGSCA